MHILSGFISFRFCPGASAICSEGLYPCAWIVVIVNMRAKWGRRAAKDQKGAEASREAIKLRAGQGYKLLTLVAALSSPAMHACFGSA